MSGPNDPLHAWLSGGGGISVQGGETAIDVEYDTLHAALRILHACRSEVAETTGRVAAIHARLARLDAGADPSGAQVTDTALALASSCCRSAVDAIAHREGVVALAVWQYQGADLRSSDALAELWHRGTQLVGDSSDAVQHAPVALLGAGTTYWRTQSLSAGASRFVAEDPWVGAATAEAIGMLHDYTPMGEFLDQDALGLRTLLPDGSPNVHAAGTSVLPADNPPPRGVRDLLGQLDQTDSGQHGEVQVRILSEDDGTRRVVVDIPGTKSWNPNPYNHDVTSPATNVRALSGHDTSYQDGVLDAMRSAGVRPDDRVLVVGHSLGGEIAVNLAAEASRSKRFDVTDVITAGSPIGRIVGNLPTRVDVLALENEHDVVPALDGMQNPPSRNVTTVTTDVDHHSIEANHSLREVYTPEANEVDHSTNARLRQFRTDIHDYCTADREETKTYVITRSYP